MKKNKTNSKFEDNKILLISFSNIDQDGRLRELVNSFNTIGKTLVFCKANTSQESNFLVFKRKSYLLFIIKLFQIAIRIKKIDYLVIDNRKAILPSFLIKNLLRPKKIIYDCRELYFINEVKHLSGKIGCILEGHAIKKSSIIVAANEERAQIMMDFYKLKIKPIVFENIRKLSFFKTTNLDSLQQKYNYLIKNNEFRVISTSGCIISRLTEELVIQIKNVNYQVRLILVGDTSDRARIETTAKDNQITNLDILGNVNQDELKFLLSISHIGFVAYHQNDANNKYCASGKAYEFIYESLPLITSTNPPLKNLCDKHLVGISSLNFSESINEIIRNYSFYKNNVMSFGSLITVFINNQNFISRIVKLL
jgi:hypothetical protein